MARQNQFCFSDGEAIRQDGGAGRAAPKALPPGSGLRPGRGQAKARIPSDRTIPS